MLIPFLALLVAQAVPATPPAKPSPPDAAAGDWRPISDDELMVITLVGNRQVVIRLAAAYAPAHVANVRALARAHWWDAASVYRVQENWVAQWGDATERKPLPAGIVEVPAAEFEIAAYAPAQTLPRPDGYALYSGITADGWPVASDGKADALLRHGRRGARCVAEHG